MLGGHSCLVIVLQLFKRMLELVVVRKHILDCKSPLFFYNPFAEVSFLSFLYYVKDKRLPGNLRGVSLMAGKYEAFHF